MRIEFQQGQQEKFIIYCIQKLSCNLRELSDKLKIDYSCLKKYKREKCRIPERIFLKLCRISKVNPKTLEISKYPDNLGQIIGGKRGILSMREKYFRRLKEWRAKGGRNHSK